MIKLHISVVILDWIFTCLVHKEDRHDKKCVLQTRGGKRKEYGPDELDGVSFVIFDRGEGEEIPKGSSILLVVQKPTAVAFPGFHGAPYLGHFILVCLRSLKKSAEKKKRTDPSMFSGSRNFYE